MNDRKDRDRLMGMLLTDQKFADAVFDDPDGVLTELGFGSDEIDAVKKLPRTEFHTLSDRLDSRLTEDQRTSSKECFEDDNAR